jgi:alpha-glucosidase
VVARQKGRDWYIGAIGDGDARDITIGLSFLDDGNYLAEIYQDGINAEKYAEDYKVVNKTSTRDDKLTFHLAPGGGWLMKLSKK